MKISLHLIVIMLSLNKSSSVHKDSSKEKFDFAFKITGVH